MNPVLVIESDVEPEGGDGVMWRTLTSADRTPTARLTSGVCEILPGCALQIHRHPTLELYYFLEGSGIVTLGSEEHAVRAGTTIYIPAETVHGIRNDGSALLKLFYVFPVDSFDEVAYTML
ncbi:MAG: cupin domain-containing protein [Steroidobacteraceae bacterium]|jgi:quercetin dioxygenase-like cupin family protein